MRAKHFFRVLNRQVAQTACAVNRNPLARTDAGNFNGFISSYAGTSNAGSLRRIQTFRDFDRVIGTHDTVGRHAAVGSIASVQYRAAQGFAAGIAVFARTAALEQPCDADTVADFQIFHTVGNFFNQTDAFVSQHATRFVAVIACRNMQVGVAHAAILDFH